MKTVPGVLDFMRIRGTAFILVLSINHAENGVSVGEQCDCCFVITVFLLFGVFLQLRRLLSLTRSPPDKEALFRSIKTPSSSSSPSSSVGKVETSSLSVLWKCVCQIRISRTTTGNPTR